MEQQQKELNKKLKNKEREGKEATQAELKQKQNLARNLQKQKNDLKRKQEEMKKLNNEYKTSFIFSTHDEKIMSYLKRIISTSGLFVVPKTGHTINLEEPALFNQQLASFYQSIENKSWKKRDDRAEIIIN